MPGNKQKPASDKFIDGEKVLCYHGPLLYEAKVNRVQMKDKVQQYWIHYNGWSKSWDEWVPESRVLKINDATLQKQKDLQQQYPHAERQKKTASKRKADKRKDFEPPLRKRRTRQEVSECSTRDSSPQHQDINIEYPDNIKKRLVDDWDLITRQKQLVRLPKKLTVCELLEKYQLHLKTTSPDELKSGQVVEVCSGLIDYFDVMLGTQLLYKFERPQYSDILQNYSDKSPSEVFGIEHFLRLFVRLGSMLSYTPMSEDNQTIIQTHIQHLLKYLDSEVDNLAFEYDAAPAEYLRRQT